MNAQVVSEAKNRMLKLAEPVGFGAPKPKLKLVFDADGKLTPEEENRLFDHIYSALEIEAKAS